MDTLKYVQAYYELVKLFNICGSGFGFVTSDVEKKLKIIQSHYDTRDKANGIVTLQQMIRYEKDSNLFLKDPKYNSTRNLLRLNRAAEFIRLLIEFIITKDDSMSQSTWEAYEQTLAHYHPWVVRKAVGVAVYAMPSKETMLERMEITREEARLLLPELVIHQKVVYDALTAVYENEGLFMLA